LRGILFFWERDGNFLYGEAPLRIEEEAEEEVDKESVLLVWEKLVPINYLRIYERDAKNYRFGT
jgi:hypothetical protein